MNAGVALVHAYLQLNGYFTSAEFPVIAGRKGGRYEELTDLDMLAVRLPLASHVVAGGRPGPEDDVLLEPDPLLDPVGDGVDVLVAEVKEGRARINEATRSAATLYAALSRVGCVPAPRMEDVVRRLAATGRVRLGGEEAPLPCRIRLVAFGEGPSGRREGYEVVSLGHVAVFVSRHLDRYHEILHPADLRDPVLGLLHLLRKLRVDVAPGHGGGPTPNG